jgi:hypothetical protein
VLFITKVSVVLVLAIVSTISNAAVALTIFMPLVDGKNLGYEPSNRKGSVRW